MSSAGSELTENVQDVDETNFFGPGKSAEGIEDLPVISKHSIEYGKCLSCGTFSQVFSASIKDYRGLANRMMVAVKRPRINATQKEMDELMKESFLLQLMDHQNVIRGFGAILQPSRPVLIMESMPGGDLLTYLRSKREANENIMLKEICAISRDIAEGGVYLSDNKIYHGGICASNMLLSSKNPRNRVVKIADFSYSLYDFEGYNKERGPFTTVLCRWAAPEVLSDEVTSPAADVWSFGVTLWEIFTGGEKPYEGKSLQEVIGFVEGGSILPKPSNVPEPFWKLLKESWNFAPAQRPTFQQEKQVIEAIQEDPGENMSFELRIIKNSNLT